MLKSLPSKTKITLNSRPVFGLQAGWAQSGLFEKFTRVCADYLGWI